jgi:hypothetical protein
MTPVPHGGWTVMVVRPDEEPGVVVVEADEDGGLLDGVAGGNPPQEAPTPCLDRIGSTASARRKGRLVEVRMEVSCTSHTPL